MIFSLVYVSDCNMTVFGEAVGTELQNMQKHAEYNNDLYDVRGFLFYYQNKFLQILQGDFDSIISIFGKIKDDPRHSNLRIIWFSNADKHEFSNWSMLHSMTFMSENFKQLSIQPSTIGRFVPDEGHLSPQAFRMLMAVATQTRDELNGSQEKLFG